LLQNGAQVVFIYVFMYLPILHLT